MSTRIERVGFIGAGIMGAPLAAHLLKAGFRVSLHSRTRAKAEPVLAAGAAWAETPAAAAADCDVLLTIVTDTPDVESVLFGPAGAAPALKRGAVVVDMTTTSPAGAQRCAARLAERGVVFLDAPVTGGATGAQNAALTIMVGGDSAAFERVRPVLAVFARTIAHVGPSGGGQWLKACNQVLCAANLIGVCEALLLARRAGLDLAESLSTLAGGAGGSWAWSTLGAKIAAGDLQPMFMIKLMQKDLRIVQEAAERLGVPLPGVALAQQLFRSVENEPGGTELGTQAMIRAYEKLAGPERAELDRATESPGSCG